MKIDTLFGPAAPELGWVPSIRYLLRRARLREIFKRLPRAPLLEVGCGSGAFLAELSASGFECLGLETSTQAAAIARYFASLINKQDYEIVAHPGHDWDARFGWVCAFDVLEHIEDESAALHQWHRWLSMDGRLLISVPAHSRKWGPGDVWAGHHRRYERAQLKQLMANHGFELEHFECYGFPGANLTEWLGQRSYARMLAERGQNTEASFGSAQSGINRKPYLRIYRHMSTPLGRLALQVAMTAQELFLRFDIGSGYIVLARRR